MSRSRFPMGGLPPMPQGGQPSPLQVAAPLNDQQLLCLMASHQLTGVPTPSDEKALMEQVNGAVVRSIGILRFVMYHTARGNIAGSIRQGIQAGEIDAKAAAEAEVSQQPEPPGRPSIIAQA